MQYRSAGQPCSNRSCMSGFLLPLTAAIILSPGLLPNAPAAAFAQGGGFYGSISVPLEGLAASFEKTVDNSAANTLVPEPRRGMVLHDEDSGSALAAGVGFLGGYRLPLGGSGNYLGAEVDAALHGGSVEGRLDGVGESAGRNQLGESWPDRWSLARDRSYGVSLRLGSSPGFLQSRQAGIYVLGGICRAEGRFTTRFNGCLDPSPCSAGGDPDFSSGSDSRDLVLQGWSAGIGVEKELGRQMALRAEIRYTRYGTERWVTPFDEVGVRVPASVDASDVSLLLRMSRYF